MVEINKRMCKSEFSRETQKKVKCVDFPLLNNGLWSLYVYASIHALSMINKIHLVLMSSIFIFGITTYASFIKKNSFEGFVIYLYEDIFIFFGKKSWTTPDHDTKKKILHMKEARHMLDHYFCNIYWDQILGSTRHFFLKYPVPRQEYGRCYQRVNVRWRLFL